MYQFATGGVRNLALDRTKEVKIISHGWVDNADAFWYADTKDNYLTRGNANIVAIDWSRHASTLYSISVNRLPDVARFTALMILELSDTQNIPLSNFHLIGHSLGAHLFGFVGQHIFAMRGQRIGRITGLDPAGPLFEGNPPDRRLSPDDATFVDVVHTDSGGLGMRASVGDVDFYPNGGVSRQAGCGLLQIGCSHSRAPLFFHESILSNGFITVRCNTQRDFNSGSCNNNHRTVMGENVDRTARGDFYLNTAGSFPFALGRL